MRKEIIIHFSPQNNEKPSFYNNTIVDSINYMSQIPFVINNEVLNLILNEDFSKGKYLFLKNSVQ